MDEPSVAAYEAAAAAWRDRRGVLHPERAAAFGRRAASERGAISAGPIVDLGCGPGGHLAHLGPSTVGLDASAAMIDLARAATGSRLLVRADLEALPFRRVALGGAWAARTYVHVAPERLPLALADLHRSLAPGAPVELHLFAAPSTSSSEANPPGDTATDTDTETDTDTAAAGDGTARGNGTAPGDGTATTPGGEQAPVGFAAYADDPFPGRRFSAWPPERLGDVLAGAGFAVDSLQRDDTLLLVSARRAATLPDYVGPGLRLLVCGLNPSHYAAERGVGFARPGNRFWPAALAAGLASRPLDPRWLVRHDRVGMTDLVKRATAAASELSAAEYRDGVARLSRLVGWLRPRAVCFVGLAGWRAAVDRRATPGPVAGGFAGRPAYVMPNTSGLNASSTPGDLADHLRAALALADSAYD